MRILVFVVASLVGTGSLQAQDAVDSTTAMISTKSGVFTAEQAESGAKVYRKNCTSCHAPVGYTGLAFRRVWNGRSVFEFFDLIRTTMPNDEPGKLSRGEYAEIMAYLLKLNGLPSGEAKLPDDDEGLKKIRIEIQPPSPPPPAPPRR